MRKRTFCGELYSDDGSEWLGMIHKSGENEFVVRKPAEFGNSIGPIIFDDKRFSGGAFKLIRIFAVSASQRVKQYRFKTAAETAGS